MLLQMLLINSLTGHLHSAQGGILEGKIFHHTLQHRSFLSLINLILWASVPSVFAVWSISPNLPACHLQNKNLSLVSLLSTLQSFLSSSHLSDLISFSMSNLDVPPSLLSMGVCTLAVWLNPINRKVSNGESFVCGVEKS